MLRMGIAIFLLRPRMNILIVFISDLIVHLLIIPQNVSIA